MTGAITTGELFDSEFLAAVSRLRLVAKRVALGGRFAEQRSRSMGSGIEFRDYRAYTAGDDLRAIDWNIYRRLGRVFLRLFEELEDLPVYLLVDHSKSLFLENPPRIVPGLRAAFALSSIALGQHDTVGAFAFSDDCQTLLRPQAGKNRLLRFADRLAAIEPGGQTDFGRAMKRFGSLGLREGLVVVVSDFFDPGGASAVVESLKKLRHRLLLVQLTRSSDRDPQLLGDIQLRDCESGDSQDVSITKKVLERYQDAYDAFQQELTTFVRQRGGGLLQLDGDRPIVPQLASLFETGSYQA